MIVITVRPSWCIDLPRRNTDTPENSNTELLIFDVAHVISELSAGMTLKAGTIISMGTPAGVGMGFQPPRCLLYTSETEG